MTHHYRFFESKPKSLQKPLKFLVYAVVAVLLVAIIGVIVFLLVRNDEETVQIPRGAVVTNGYQCAQIGASILKKGGTAVDAAIAALFCEGVSMPQSMGLGGGFLMTIYNKDTGTAVSLNARETAPLGATEDMFDGNSSLSTKGGKAVAVPGELKGYEEAYKKYGGKVPWRDLVQPTIDLCKNGILVTEYLAKLFSSQEYQFVKDPIMKETFIDPATGKAYLQNQYVKMPRLAKTLELIAEFGADVLYNGTLTESFVKDIQDYGGIITVEDMNNYSIEWQESIKINISDNQVLYSSPLPGSGVILGFIMNILSGFLDNNEPRSIINWQRIVESFKYGYGKRTELGDPNFVELDDLLANLSSPSYAAEIRRRILDDKTFQDPTHYGAKAMVPEDHGTAHVSILAPNGDAVSVTSTINLYFGAGFMSASTGIILNDEMDDFSSPNITSAFDMPPSVANYIKPGKRPLSSMCPSIIVGEGGDVELVIGAAGGTKITTSVAQIAVKNLWFNLPIDEAVSDRRLHHQLYPMMIEYEDSFQNDIDFVSRLYNIGHNYSIASPGTGFSAVTAISRKKGLKTASDIRRSGEQIYIF